MTDVIVPTKPEELEEMLHNPAQMQDLIADPGKFDQFITNYAHSVSEKDKTQALQIKEQVEVSLQNWLKTQKPGKELRKVDLTSENLGSNGWGARNAAHYNPQAAGAKVDEVWDGPADFFRNIHHKPSSIGIPEEEYQPKRNKAQSIQNSFGSTVPADGGFLVPEQLRSDIMTLALESGITRPRAQVIPMDSLITSIPGVDETSHASSLFGGIVFYWAEEGATLTESQAAFKRVRLQAKKLAGRANVPNELLADAVGFLPWFNQNFPAALAWFEDDSFINGNGVGEPLGWAHADNTATVTVTKETGQPADTVVWENLVKMYSRMYPSSLGTAVWVVSPDTFPELATMALSVGTGGSAIWLNNGASGPPTTILGRPVLVTEKVPKLGDAGDISFVDLRYYAIGDRQTMQVDSSPHVLFLNDVTVFRVIERVDGRPLVESAITPANSGPTLSPFVRLGERA